MEAGERPADQRASEPRAGVAWGQLRPGMDPVEVLSMFGEPKHVKVSKINTTWYYSDRGAEGPFIVFDTRGMSVERWQAPDSGPPG